MKRIAWMAALGLGLWGISNMAQAHVDLSVGIGVPMAPVYVPPVYAPAPVVAYPAYDEGDDDGYRHWRHEHYEHWREHEEHEREHWREHHWHDGD